ncbi:UNKNOWN [Stylonychia lemnae]|uniref:Uncharacterized protein n=1 Tax=Stylonychia lemnae TaxID=5949 RepID=A0A077ZSI3_STYLE|nr:UNKNOWN [Stylonychia lemnae]|eukprot:CDW72833.1 UNKNOWN [Stylonychia lemnae]
MKIYQPHIQKLRTSLLTKAHLLTQSSRQQFSSAEGEQEQPTFFKGQNIRYIPKKRLQFDYVCADGPMHLIFQASEDNLKRTQSWKISTAVAVPATLLAYFTLGASQMFVYPMLFLPTLYNLYDSIRLRKLFGSECHKLWLYKNGDQVLMQTFDGMLHKMNIIDMNSHQLVDKKDYLNFIVNNSGRDYLLSNKNCAAIDYDLIDRIIKGIQIDSNKFQSLYNRLIYRQTPQNLKPQEFNRFLPQALNFNENRTIWKILNRTIYREDSRNWLRNQSNFTTELSRKNITPQEREVIRKLIKDHGIKYLYSEKQFYKIHKMSRAEFLKKLDACQTQEEKETVIMALYEDPFIQGRRGVVDVEEAVRIVHRKIEEREKFFKFSEKFARGIDLRQASRSGTSFASLKDLV